MEVEVIAVEVLTRKAQDLAIFDDWHVAEIYANWMAAKFRSAQVHLWDLMERPKKKGR